MADQPIVPTRQKEIVFYEDRFYAVQLEDGRIFVPVRRLCDVLGLSYQGQIDRIRRNAVLSKYELQIRVEPEDGKGGVQLTNCLPLNMVTGWLFGVSTHRVREELKEKLERYQERVYDVIWDHFRDEIEGKSVPATTPVEELEAIAQMGLAIYRLARQQRAMDQRLGTLEEVVWEMEERTQLGFEVVRQEVGALELRLQQPPTGKISEQQAADLSQAVKLVAITLGQQSGRTEFGAIYGELYRRFGITSYRNLPTHAFQEAMEWLTDWYRSLHMEDETTDIESDEQMSE